VLTVSEVEVSSNCRGSRAGFLEGVRLKPLHRPIEVFDVGVDEDAFGLLMAR
jgi:hypothetical protein